MKKKLLILGFVVAVGVLFYKSGSKINDCDFGCDGFPDCKCIDEIEFR